MSQSVDLRALNRAMFASAKRYWAGAGAAKLLMFAIALWGALTASWRYTPQLVLVVGVLSECLQLRSDVIRSRAESLLRTLDLCRSFARDITAADKRDIVMAAPHAFRELVEYSRIEKDSYFASDTLPGARMAIENLQESAWYTKHQAKAMAAVYAAVVAILLVLAVMALVVAVREVPDTETRDIVVRAVTAWLTLIVSLSMLKSVWAYLRLEARAAKTESACIHLLAGDVSEADAVKQWYEYQLARSSAPLIPDWLWNAMSSRLGHAWQSKAV